MPVLAVVGAMVAESAIGAAIVSAVGSEMVGMAIAGAIGGGIGGGLGSMMMGGSFGDGFKSGAIGGMIGGGLEGFAGAGAAGAGEAFSNATTGSISAGQLAQEASLLGTSASSVAADLAAQGFSASQIADVLGSGASPLTDYNSAQELANNATSQFGQAQVPTSFETDYGGFAVPSDTQVPTSFETDYGGFAKPYSEAQSPTSLNSLYGTQQTAATTYPMGSAATQPTINGTPLSDVSQQAPLGSPALADSGQTVEQMNAANAAAQPSWLSSLREQAKQFGGQGTSGGTGTLNDIYAKLKSPQGMMATMDTIQGYQQSQQLQDLAKQAQQPYNQYMDTFSNPGKYWNEYSTGVGAQQANAAARQMAKSGRTGMLPTLNQTMYQNYMGQYLPTVRSGLANASNMAQQNVQNMSAAYKTRREAPMGLGYLFGYTPYANKQQQVKV